MSVNWDWKRKMGELIMEQTQNDRTIKFKVNIYEANCLCAIIYDFKGESETEKNKDGTPKIVDKYNFWGWFNDLGHLKNYLGLSKEYAGDDSFKDGINRLIKVKLNTYYNYKMYGDTDRIMKMAMLFTKAGYKVELYYKEPKEDR